jgi:predicted DNA-binding protein (MmcQ/YjbR family)
MRLCEKHVAPEALMDLAAFREYCLAKPDATEGTPFGPDVIVFKVGGKMFALASLDGVPPSVNLKCDPARALDLRDRYEEVRPGYHMNKKHWNTIELSGRIPPHEIREWIDHSYDLVARRLPKRKSRSSRSR